MENKMTNMYLVTMSLFDIAPELINQLKKIKATIFLSHSRTS